MRISYPRESGGVFCLCEVINPSNGLTTFGKMHTVVKTFENF